MKRIKYILLAVLCLAAMLALAGCGTTPQENAAQGEGTFATFTDAAGRSIKLDKKPERIAVTSASFLEPLHEVGGDVVGRPDSATNMPDWAKDKESIGKVYQIDVEKLLATKPDLVLINKGMNEKLIDTLEANGVNTVVLDMKSYDNVKDEIRIMAKLTGETEKGENLISSMDAKIDKIKEELPKDRERIFIIHSTNQGLTVQLSGSIAGCAAHILGWDNLAGDMTPLEKNPDAAPYSLETLVEKNPDVIFITSMGKLEDIKAGMEKQMAENPAWQSVNAVKNHRVYYLPQDQFLLSPGIHYPEAVETMARCIYPQLGSGK